MMKPGGWDSLPRKMLIKSLIHIASSPSRVLQFSPSRRAGAFFGAWCNGSTADFGSVYSGSNPDAPACEFGTLSVLVEEDHQLIFVNDDYQQPSADDEDPLLSKTDPFLTDEHEPAMAA